MGNESPVPSTEARVRSTAYPLHATDPSESSDAKSAVFGTTSAVCAALTVLIMAFFIDKAAQEKDAKAQPWAWLIVLAGGAMSTIAAGLTSAVGTVTGGVALARGERKDWLARVGLLVNVPVALFALYVVAATQFGN